MTRNEWRITFGDNLSDILKDAKVTQKEFAKDSGLSVGSVSDYINKWTVPNVPAILNMAYALDMEVDDLVDFGDRIDG